MEMKLFNKWSVEGITIKDPGLKNYINLKPLIVPHNHGRHGKKQFYKSEISIVERLLNHMQVPGHRGKKHLISSGKCSGKKQTQVKVLEDVFSQIEEKTKENPVAVLVKAIENAALREEITSFQLGGIMVRKAVITSPQRRIDLTMRLLTQSAYQKSRDNPKGYATCLADEIVSTFRGDSATSTAIREKERIEREAAGAR